MLPLSRTPITTLAPTELRAHYNCRGDLFQCVGVYVEDERLAVVALAASCVRFGSLLESLEIQSLAMYDSHLALEFGVVGVAPVESRGR